MPTEAEEGEAAVTSRRYLGVAETLGSCRGPMHGTSAALLLLFVAKQERGPKGYKTLFLRPQGRPETGFFFFFFNRKRLDL